MGHAANCQRASGCKCELRAPSDSSLPFVASSVPTVHVSVLPAPTVVVGPMAVSGAEPGIFSIDSGPPSPIDQAPDLGRAPPVA